MNIKNTIKKTLELAAIVGIAGVMYSCDSIPKEKGPNDSSYNPYTPIALEDISKQEEGKRVIVTGNIRKVEDERLILESKSQIASILRDEKYVGGNTNETRGVEWDSIVPILSKGIKNLKDTNNIYSGETRFFCVVDTNSMARMRFFEMNGNFYEAFKKN